MLSGITFYSYLKVTSLADINMFYIIVLKQKKIFVTCDVPQGSILGPLYFIRYMINIFNISSYLFYILHDDDP